MFEQFSELFTLNNFALEQVPIRIVESIVILLILWGVNVFIERFVHNSINDVEVQYQWRRGLKYTLIILGLLLIGRLWIGEVQSLITFLGLVSAGLAIALGRVIANLVGWVYIISRTPFKVGDRIEIGDHAGDVIDIRAFQFIILEIGNWVEADQSTGRIIHIPNEKVFTQPLANYGEGFAYIWNEIPVLLTFESNWQQAKQLLQEIADQNTDDIATEAARDIHRASRYYPIRYSKLTPAVYTKVVDNGVLLTIRYLCRMRRRRSTEEILWEAILQAFGELNDIDFAYPTQRLYYK